MIVDDLGISPPAVYYRYREGRELIEKREEFWPYFYSNERTNKGTAQTIDGKTVFKKYYNKSSLRYYFAKSLTDSYEVDISLENRFLIDNFETLPEYEPRVWNLDIETTMGLDTKKADKATTAITFHDSYIDEYITLSWKEGYTGENERHNDNWNIYIFENEKLMLKDFTKQMKEYNPDIICGWNLVNFDIPYIINRMYRIGLNPNELSSVGQVEA